MTISLAKPLKTMSEEELAECKRRKKDEDEWWEIKNKVFELLQKKEIVPDELWQELEKKSKQSCFRLLHNLNMILHYHDWLLEDDIDDKIVEMVQRFLEKATEHQNSPQDKIDVSGLHKVFERKMEEIWTTQES